MQDYALFWLILTLLCLCAEAYYTSIEMAMVSFNKVRLQYYLSESTAPSYAPAKRINWMLQHPSRLFGTTLLGVNIAMLFGSECSRHLYAALSFNPDLSPLTQIPLVLIFAELAPIFAARRYPEHLSMSGSFLVYASAKAMAPAIWTISLIAKFANWLVGGQEVVTEGFITRDELQIILETGERELLSSSETDDLNLLARNIFSLRGKTAAGAMRPLASIRGIPSNTTVGYMRQLVGANQEPFMVVFHLDPTNIVGIAYVRDLVKVADSQRVRDHTHSPWFITQDTDLMQILQQFRRNQQTVAVILNNQGQAIGLLTLDDVIEEIFPQIAIPVKRLLPGGVIIDKIFPGDLRIAEFNKRFVVRVNAPETATLAELLEQGLGHHPEAGESLMIGHFQLIVEESSLLEIKRVRIRTR